MTSRIACTSAADNSIAALAKFSSRYLLDLVYTPSGSVFVIHRKGERRTYTRDRKDVGTLRDEPRECELTRGAAFLLGKELERFDKTKVLGKVFLLEPREEVADVAGGEVIRRREPPGEEACIGSRIAVSIIYQAGQECSMTTHHVRGDCKRALSPQALSQPQGLHSLRGQASKGSLQRWTGHQRTAA